jgi:hypothetical protein
VPDEQTVPALPIVVVNAVPAELVFIGVTMSTLSVDWADAHDEAEAKNKNNMKDRRIGLHLSKRWLN